MSARFNRLFVIGERGHRTTAQSAASQPCRFTRPCLSGQWGPSVDRIGELVQIIGADALSVEVWAGALRPDLLDGKAEVAGAASERRPADARRGVSPVVACRPVWRSSPVALPTHLAFASPSSPPADLAEQLRISPQAQLGLINQLVALEGCAEPPDGQPGGLGRGVTGASASGADPHRRRRRSRPAAIHGASIASRSIRPAGAALRGACWRPGARSRRHTPSSRRSSTRGSS